MIGWITLAAVAVFVLALAGLVVWRWKRPPKLKQDYFKTEWQELQKLLRNKDRWDVALVRADKLFDIALKKNRFRGASMGERMVKAQKLFTDNDGAWFAHKLRKEVESNPDFKLKEDDLKTALIAIRQVLKDLGALKR
ncbi:MAG TPA: hypothetical protein VL737_03715 [Candidatus Pristimantibacillus sp.]|jgi:hypothetical protein|nr:hypothetical protein [Candidatus Pristimantibacillus sp.]